ncbi:MAG: hypothetical protein FWE16_01805 [Firmicutes bacterium]|nr:hypothetical protein [Bacillota bacterium]
MKTLKKFKNTLQKQSIFGVVCKLDTLLKGTLVVAILVTTAWVLSTHGSANIFFGR